MTTCARILAAALLANFLAGSAGAALLHRRSSHQGGATIALRRRLHVSSLITEPGTFEVEWNNTFDLDGSYLMPLLLKVTPQGTNLMWGRTEFSVALDSVASTVTDDHRATHLSDHATFGATTLLLDGEHWNLAIAPQASVWIRGSGGVRAGASAIVRYDRGLSSGGATVTWTGATLPSDGNPAGTWDLNPGYGRRLSAKGWTSHVSLYANGLVERSTGIATVLAAIEGMEIELKDNLSLIFSAQQTRLAAGQHDYQITTGLTINLGRYRH